MDDPSPKNSGTKFWALFEWMLAVLKLKYREVIYLCLLTMGIGCMFMSKLDQTVLTPLPEITGKDIEPYEYSTIQEECNVRPNYAVAPNDDKTKNIINRLFYNTNCTVIKYFDNYEDLNSYIKEDKTSITGLQITTYNKTIKGEIINNMNVVLPLTDMINKLTPETKDVSFSNYMGEMWNPYKIKDISILGTHIGVILPIFTVTVYSYILISKWIEQKALQLVCVAGIREIELWIALILSDVPPIIFYTFISAVNLCLDAENVTYGFCLFFYILTFASVYISAMLIIVIFRRRVPIITATIVWAIISIGVPFYVSIAANSTDKESLMNVYWIILTVFPTAPINQVVVNIYSTKGYHPNQLISFWNWPKSYGYFSTETLVIIIITQCCIYMLLFIVFMLMGSGKTGTAPIGWRNVFRASRWRSLFGRKRAEVATEKDLLAENVVKTYRGRHGDTVMALRGVSVGIDRGEVVMVIGANGSGKTTLLNIVSGTVEADSGLLAFEGVDGFGGLTHFGESVGFCFQENIFFERLTLREHLRLFGAIRRVGREALAGEIERVADAVGLLGMLDQYATSLSGGQQRKLSAAMSLIGSPRFAVLDEPTAGVDADSRQQIWRLISSFHGTTTLVSSHTIEEAEDFASRVLLLSAGKVLFEGSCQEMRERYNCGYRLSVMADEERVDMDEVVAGVLEFVQERSKGAVVDMERGNSIMLPIDDAVPGVLEALDEHLDELRIDGYQVVVESLENVLLRIIFAEEAVVDI